MFELHFCPHGAMHRTVYPVNVERCLCRVATDLGKVQEVLEEFKVEIFRALESLEYDYRHGNVQKNPGKL